MTELSLAQHVELCVGPDAVFEGTAFPSDEAREAAWREHRDRLLANADRVPWAYDYYDNGRRNAVYTASRHRVCTRNE